MTLLQPPSSKSDAQRVLVLSHVLGLPLHDVCRNEQVPRDVDVLRNGLLALAAGGRQLIDCHDGGAPFRFLLTQAALSPQGETEFTGTPRLGARPHAPLVHSLVDALAPLGLRVTQGTPWPLLVTAVRSLEGVTGFDVTGSESSQFASSLLLGAAKVVFTTGQPCEVRLHGSLTSQGYLEMTRAWLTRAGFVTLASASSTVVHSFAPRPEPLVVPGDWSSLTYLLALSWKSGVPVGRVDFAAAHPDSMFVELLENIGLSVSRTSPVRVHGQPRAGFEVDAEKCPDAVPTVAAVAAVLPFASRITRVGILRHKESDRLEAVRRLLDAAGGVTRLEGDTLTIEPAGALHDFDFDPLDDHRLAMSAAVLAFLSDRRVRLRNRACVNKSFPSFWEQLAVAGGASSVEFAPEALELTNR